MKATKSPDEIKKGLACCVIGPSARLPQCGECPYKFTPMCSDTFLRDALALIQKLQDENTEKDARIHQLEAERDALLKYITNSSWAACDICKHGVNGVHAMNCKHIREVGVPCFEWRGVQKEDGNEAKES